ncbi:MAG TPA: glycoside hydrolase family 2 TIM barrel-domain containing protein [Chitinophagaceae bacterium]
MLKRMIFSIVVVFCVFTTSAQQKSYNVNNNVRITVSVNEGWKFQYFPAEEAINDGFEKINFDDNKWTEVAAPHTWSTYETTKEVHPFIRNPSPKDNPYWWNGWGWYRRNIEIDKSFGGKKVIIEFDGVQKYCKLWLNGQLVGEHKGGFASFYFDLTKFIQPGKKNILAVAVNNQQRDRFSIPPMDAGNWDLYGGIYRDVRLVVTDKLYIPFQGSADHEGGTFITTPGLTAEKGIVNVKTFIKNDFQQAKQFRLHTIITDARNRIISEISTAKTISPGELIEIDQHSDPVNHPSLWSPSSPSLYNLYSVIESDGKTSDVYKSKFGFRWIHWDSTTNTLFLNGKGMDVQGFMRHQEYPWLGDAIPKWISLVDLVDIKQNLEMNFYRGTHYTQAAYVYDMCDSLGLMACEDVPNVKNKPFSEEVQKQQLTEMIRRDRNHPSILFWSMGDETDHAAHSEWAVQEDTTRIIYARSIVGPSAGKYVDATDSNLQFGGLLQCTVRGWYNKDIKNYEPQSSQVTGTEEWQHTKAMTANPIKANERVDMKNLIIWCYADHGCDREYKNTPLLHLNPKGWVDLYRNPKYAYYLYQANHAKKPMVFIHPHFWTKKYEGTSQDLIVDSNCDSIQLIVGNKYYETLYPGAANLHCVTFKNIPVSNHNLFAIGFKNGKRIVDTLYMTGSAAALKLSSTHATLQPANNQVAILTADIVDAKGHHVFGAGNTIRWKVEGPATLVGPSEYVSDTDKQEQMEGTMYIDAPVSNLIRSTGKPGKIIITIESNGLVSAKTEINVK